MSFFKVRTDKLEFNLEYILFYKEFSIIYSSDNTVNKQFANKVFRYIYERCDYKSYSNKHNLSKEKAHSYALNLAGLDTSFEISKVVKAAMDMYKKLNYNVNAELLKDLKATLNLSISINEKIHRALEVRLSNPDLADEQIPILITLQSKLFEVIDGLPNKISKVKELEAEVYDELAKPKELARGGDEIPDSYEGDPEIEGA